MTTEEPAKNKGFAVNAVEYPPSAIRTDTRETLELYSGDTNWAPALCLLLGSLFVGLAVYGMLVPDFIGRDQPVWFLWVFGLMGALTIYGGLSMYAMRQRMTFDSNRRILCWEHAGRGFQRVRDEYSFSAFEFVRPDFQKAVFSDDSDTWLLHLVLQSGETLTVFKTIREEAAYRVLRRLVEMARVRAEDPQGLFPVSPLEPSEEAMPPDGAPASVTPPTAFIRPVSVDGSVGYEMPAGRFNVGVLFFMLFTLIWLIGVGLGFVLLIREVMQAERPVDPASVPVFLLFMALFGGVGLLCLYITLWLLAGRQRITLGPAGIVLEDRLLGFVPHRKTFYPRDILRVDAVREESGHFSIKIFLQDKDVVKFGGSLKEAEAQWLQAQVNQLTW